MNLYFLVEGRRTETRVYPQWLTHLLPHYSRVLSVESVLKNNYFLLSGEGYPRLLDEALQRSIEDINACGRYTYFVICVDADDFSVEERSREVMARLEAASPVLDPSVSARILVQNRSIETWFLGNRAVFPRNPNGKKFREFVKFYNVSENDPEIMGMMDDHSNHADFHHEYLREMFIERGIFYTKRNPGHVADGEYLNRLIGRTQDCRDHLATFQTFLSLCRNIHQLTADTA